MKGWFFPRGTPRARKLVSHLSMSTFKLALSLTLPHVNLHRVHGHLAERVQTCPCWADHAFGLMHNSQRVNMLQSYPAALWTKDRSSSGPRIKCLPISKVGSRAEECQVASLTQSPVFFFCSSAALSLLARIHFYFIPPPRDFSAKHGDSHLVLV